MVFSAGCGLGREGHDQGHGALERHRTPGDQVGLFGAGLPGVHLAEDDDLDHPRAAGVVRLERDGEDQDGFVGGDQAGVDAVRG